MAKDKFDILEMEEKWKKYWKKEGIYKFDTNNKKKIFSIDTPPPYISGKMHIGHAFSYSQQDFIIRFMRMKGLNVFYPFGTDDNGLPTERFIEKINNVKSKDMGRADFINLCLKTLKKVTPDSIKDFVDLAISSDYGLYYSTIDDHSRRVSQKSFIDLYKGGHIHKKSFPTIWCPDCQTSIAQAELEDKEGNTLFSTLKFDVSGKELLVATTRPELLGACVAVFVNPRDKRYRGFVGKKAKVPLFDMKVPILEDESAEIDKGTGVLMICSYGDKFDVDAINRHNLEPKIVIQKDGTIGGLKVKEARKKILKELKEKNLIKEQKEIGHVVNVHDKCGTEIEFVQTPQWFISIVNKKKEFIKQGNKVNWYPNFMKKRYDNWVNGLEWDWSISRNRHFGVPIPVWECNVCREIIIPEEKELPVDPLEKEKKCPKCNVEAQGEKMVLDTWATSSLTPQIAAQLPQVKGKVKLPFSLRPQGHDIIRTWAFYTIVKGYLHEDKIPWKDIVVSGNVSLGGEKMSKSKGNMVTPQKVMEEYGADALRFWAAGSKLGNDLDYQEKDLVTGKKLVNKLRNAAKFVFMNLEDYDYKKPKKLEEVDRLFLTKVDLLIERVTHDFEKYEYSKAKLGVEKFFWKIFADNYLEIVKKRVYQGSGESRKSAQYALYTGLLSIIKLIAPIMPFVSEEIYQEHFRKEEKDKSIHISKWPKSKPKQKDLDEVSRFETLIQVISKVRQEKSKGNKAMNSEIILTIGDKVHKSIKGMVGDLKDVTNASEIKEGKFKVEFK